MTEAEKPLPKLGQRVRFHNGDEIIEGFCNGEPYVLDGMPAYVPVYVHEGDRCISVAAPNIVEVRDDFA